MVLSASFSCWSYCLLLLLFFFLVMSGAELQIFLCDEVSFFFFFTFNFSSFNPIRVCVSFFFFLFRGFFCVGGGGCGVF